MPNIQQAMVLQDHGFKSFAVIGFPIQHSLSPTIHQAFAKQFQTSIRYEVLSIEPAAFEKTLSQLKNFGGLNISLPYKIPMYHWVSKLTARAKFSKSVNSVTFFADGTTLGDNTDGAGLISDLQHRVRLHLSGANVLILGAGGAARGITAGLLDAGVAQIRILNRTSEHVLQLCQQFNQPNILAFDPYSDHQFDLIIHATSAGVLNAPLALDLKFLENFKGCFYDINYGEGAAKLKSCLPRHLNYVDGLGMLVEQAALSYQSWHSVMPNTAIVIKALAKSFNSRY